MINPLDASGNFVGPGIKLTSQGPNAVRDGKSTVSNDRRYPLNHAASAPTLDSIAKAAPISIARIFFGTILTDWRLIEKEPYRVFEICTFSGGEFVARDAVFVLQPEQPCYRHSCSKSIHTGERGVGDKQPTQVLALSQHHSRRPSGVRTFDSFLAEWFADHMDHTVRLFAAVPAVLDLRYCAQSASQWAPYSPTRLPRLWPNAIWRQIYASARSSLVFIFTVLQENIP
ncbi:hypothetical protein C8J57DRAFT_1586295 [Mycena rebaudengoi]|nr:hypothetical protein C8J57DRAFT_1586295 [Mycena rebaudengoi]